MPTMQVTKALQEFNDAMGAVAMVGKGVWGQTSLFNNSCAGNMATETCGNFKFCMTARDMKAGDELTICYVDSLDPYPKRTARFEAWNKVPRCCWG